jgi:hypothetical protein
VSLVLQKGAPAPGTPAGVTFNDVSFLRTSATGTLLFRGSLTGPGVITDPGPTLNATGIWAGPPGNIQLLARAANPAPGFPAGVNHNTFGGYSLNNAGTISFVGTVIGGEFAEADPDRSAIWVGTPGSLQVLARSRTAAPGTGAGVNFRTVGLPVVGGNTTAFIGTLSGAGVTTDVNDRGIWAGGVGSVQLVARDGDPAAGIGGGVNYDRTGSEWGTDIQGNRINPTSLPVVGPNGTVAFMSTLTGPGVNTTNDEGIWARYPTGGTHLIARTGQVIDVDPGPGVVNKTLSDVSLATGLLGSSDGYSAVNGLDAVTWRAGFTDNTTAIMVTPVPEPGTVLAVAAAGLAAGAWVRRRGRA